MARYRKGQILTLVALFCFLHLQPAKAQTATEPLVLNATVINENGRVIPRLESNDFAVFVDKEPQKIVSLSSGDVPTSVGIVVDVSGSLANRSEYPTSPLLQRIADGIDRLLQVGNPQNEYFVAAFNSTPGLVLDWSADGRTMREKLLKLEFNGSTALYDGLYKSIEYVKTGRHRKRVIILASDGIDWVSKKTFKEVREFVKDSDVVLYAIGLVDNSVGGSTSNQQGQGILAKLTHPSGGRALFFPDYSNARVVNETFELIGTELRSQYQLSVDTQNISAPRKWRKLTVKASYLDASGRKRDLNIKTREGFYR